MGVSLRAFVIAVARRGSRGGGRRQTEVTLEPEPMKVQHFNQYLVGEVEPLHAA